ncbi:MAG TPA: ADOP family duplicated permease [Bryobacteraceae bacterium]|jgi:predicted permease
MKLLRRLRYLLRHRQMDRDLAEELEFHRSLQSDPRQLGNVTLARENAREVWLLPWLQTVWQDAMYALRSLRRQPGFTFVALLTLGLAIGFNTSFFTVFNILALKPWPVRDPGRVVIITPQREPAAISLDEAHYLGQQARLLSGATATSDWIAHLGFEGSGRGTRVKLTTANFFEVLGISMETGRGFLPEEDRPEAPAQVTVLSYGFWRDRFGSDPDIVGKQISMDGTPFTVVGVASREYTGIDPNHEKLWIPFAIAPRIQPQYRPDVVSVAGRLTPGASRASAAAELTVLSDQFQNQFKLKPHGILLSGTTFFERPGAKREILPVAALMFLGVTLVFLLACANVGNLLVARAAARQTEIAMRRSLGASRTRIVRQLLTESMVLALAACALGVTLAYWLPNAVADWVGQSAPFRLVPDSTVLLYALALAVVACVSFGLAPALQGTRPDSGARRFPLRSALLGAQVTISSILLIAAGLLVDGIQQARRQDPGFSVAGVSVISFELPTGWYEASKTRAFYNRLRDDLKTATAGEPYAFARHEPLSGSNSVDSAWTPEHPQPVRVIEQSVSPGYFAVLNIRILAGRNLEATDSGTDAIVVNESLARSFDGQDVRAGQTLMIGRTAHPVAGIVKDTYSSRLDRVEPMYYQLYRAEDATPRVLVRDAQVGSIAAAASAIDPRIRAQAVPLSHSLELSLESSRAGAEIAGLLGGFALILATVGMAGVFAYAVQQRTKEIGIRMALGARPPQVIRLILGASSRAVLSGLTLGFLAAIPVSRLMRSQLFGVSPFDPVAYLSVAVVFAAAATAASYAPARRASRIDPSSALRYE